MAEIAAAYQAPYVPEDSANEQLRWRTLEDYLNFKIEARVWRTSAFTQNASTETFITWQTSEDDSGLWDGTTKLVIPEGGGRDYFIDWMGATSDYLNGIAFKLYINGNHRKGQRGTRFVGNSLVVPLQPGDEIQVQASNQGHAANISVLGGVYGVDNLVTYLYVRSLL